MDSLGRLPGSTLQEKALNFAEVLGAKIGYLNRPVFALSPLDNLSLDRGVPWAQVTPKYGRVLA